MCFLLTGILNSIKEDLVLLKNLTLMTGAVGILTENEPCFCHMCTERNQLLKQAGQYCFRLLFPSPEDLLDMGTETESPTLQADSEKSEPPEKPLFMFTCCNKNLRNVC